VQKHIQFGFVITTAADDGSAKQRACGWCHSSTWQNSMLSWHYWGQHTNHPVVKRWQRGLRQCQCRTITSWAGGRSRLMCMQTALPPHVA